MADPDQNPAPEATPAGTPDQAETAATEEATEQAEATELERARAEARDYLARLARLQAEFENFRRRSQREREETMQYANLALVRDFLPVLDNLERALGVADSATVDTLKSGLELIARQFRDVLEKAGVAPVSAVEQPFDPTVHEAVQQVEGDYEVPTVVEEYQKGYRMGERLVRPSMVKVARK